MVNDYSYPGYQFVIKPMVDFAKSYEYYKTIGKVQNTIEDIVFDILSTKWYFVDLDEEQKAQDKAKKDAEKRRNDKQKQMADTFKQIQQPPQQDQKKEANDADNSKPPGVVEAEQWAKKFKLRRLIEYMIRDMMVTGNCMIGTTDWQPVQIDSIVGLKRDEFGVVSEYIQMVRGRWVQLPLKPEQYIHCKFIEINRNAWAIGMFHSLTDQFTHNNKPSVPEFEIYRRHIQNAAKIEEKYASPVVIWAYENITPEVYKRQKKELESLSPGDRRITSRKPELITETIDGRSALIGTITPIIDDEINSGLGSSANRMINKPSAMADARVANQKDDGRKLGIMEKIFHIINEDIIPLITDSNVEFRWGAQNKLNVELPQGLADAVQIGLVGIHEGRNILAEQSWHLDDAAFEDEQMQAHAKDIQKMQIGANLKQQQNQQDDGNTDDNQK